MYEAAEINGGGCKCIRGGNDVPECEEIVFVNGADDIVWSTIVVTTLSVIHLR